MVERMLCRARAERIALAVGWLVVTGCGAGASTTSNRALVRAGADMPLSVEENRNAPPPPAPRELEIRSIVLWCSQPSGAACTAAQTELGAVPTRAEEVPMFLVGPGRDEADDCTDADLGPLMQRVTSAVGASTRGWMDQEGVIRSAERVADLYSGSGCTNAAAVGEPPVKIHVVDFRDAPRFLVRIWEIGEGL